MASLYTSTLQRRDYHGCRILTPMQPCKPLLLSVIWGLSPRCIVYCLLITAGSSSRPSSFLAQGRQSHSSGGPGDGGAPAPGRPGFMSARTQLVTDLRKKGHHQQANKLQQVCSLNLVAGHLLIIILTLLAGLTACKLFLIQNSFAADVDVYWLLLLLMLLLECP